MRKRVDRISEIFVRSRRVWVPFILMVAILVSTLASVPPVPEPEPAPEQSEAPLPEETPPPVFVTAEQMSRLHYTDSILGELHWSLSDEELAELNRVLLEYSITSAEEIAQFLAQATVESSAGKGLAEWGDEEYFQSHGYTAGTRGAGYLHLTHDYGQMAFSIWMMKKYVPGLEHIEYVNPSSHGKETVFMAYYQALRTAADLGCDVSRYSRIVYDAGSTLSTGADYIAEQFAWESAAYFWHIAGVAQAFSVESGVENTDIASGYVGGSNWQSRREAYLAFYPVLCN